MNGQGPPSKTLEHISINILGIGEITTTIEVKGTFWGKIHPVEKRWMRLAYKRLPPFADRAAVDNYLRAHNAYQDLLEKIGVPVPWHDNLIKQRPDGKWTVYNRQERFPANQVTCLLIRECGPETVIAVFRLVASRLARIFEHNQNHPEQLIGFDGQISNWILPDYDVNKGASDDCGSDFSRDLAGERILYIDTSTPLLRSNNAEQLDTELFLKSVPALFRPLVRRFMLQQVLDRYYVPREVMLDLVASFFTHHRPDMVPALVEEANRIMAESSWAREVKPFTLQEITAYHREDVMIWQIFRTLKRLDRYILERFMGGKYEQRLPSGSPSKWKNLVGAGGPGLSRED